MRIALSLLVLQRSVFSGFGESLEVCRRLDLEVNSLTILQTRWTEQRGRAGQTGQTDRHLAGVEKKVEGRHAEPTQQDSDQSLFLDV